jgi:hypothetical protein
MWRDMAKKSVPRNGKFRGEDTVGTQRAQQLAGELEPFCFGRGLLS